MDSYQIERRKKLNELRQRAKREAKLPYCVLCGQDQTSFCNSHSVPRMILKRIAIKGEVLQANSLIEFALMDIDDGLNDAGTFHLICEKCDHEYFVDYEEQKNLICSFPTEKMLAEIALKGVLLQLGKRLIEKRMFEIKADEYNHQINLESKIRAQELDIRDYTKDLEFYKSLIRKPEKDCFQVVFWKILPYTVPIATQSSLALPKDMNGQVLVDVDVSSDERVQIIHVGIFPLTDCSLVFLFYHKRDAKYRPLKKQFRSKPDKECLDFINWMIFKYTENYFISKDVKSLLDSSSKLKELSRDMFDTPNLGMFPSFLKPFYSPVEINEIPNLLNPEFKIQ